MKTIITLTSISLLALGCGSEKESENPQPSTTVTIEAQKEGPQAENRGHSHADDEASLNRRSPSTEERQVAVQPPQSDDRQTYDSQNNVDQTPQNDYQGVAYNPNAAIAYDSQYGAVQGYQQSQSYYEDMKMRFETSNRNFANFSTPFNRPYLNDYYTRQRSFLNYQPEFNDPRRFRDYRSNYWTERDFRTIGDGFRRSQRWVNQDMFNIIMQTLNHLKMVDIRSDRRLEERILRAIDDRNHADAVRLHDELLRECEHKFEGHHANAPQRNDGFGGRRR